MYPLQKWSLVVCLFLLTSLSAHAQVPVESYGPRLREFPYLPHIGETVDGGILICGYFDFLNGDYAGRLIKLNQAGESFPGFQKVTGNGWILKAVGLSNGKIMVMGDFTELNGTPTSSLSRLNSDGSLDQTFFTNQTIYNFALQSTGKIIVFTPNGMMRLDPNGSVDNTFNVVPGNFQHSANVTVSANDLIYLITNNTSLQRFNSNGTLDGGFTEVTSDGTISLMQLTNTGILVGGWFTQVNGVPANKIALIKSDGTPDASFDVGDGPAYSQLLSMTIRSNGNILVGGNFASFDHVSGSAFELSPSGEVLQVIAQVYYSQINNIRELASQKILVTGPFSSANGLPRNGTALFNSDYTINSDFKPDITLCSQSPDLPGPVITSKGEMIVVGRGTDILGFLGGYDHNESHNRQVLRLDSLGQLDPEYDILDFYSPGWVTTLAIQPDDKLLIGGYFKIGQLVTKLARINSNGTLDHSFSFIVGQDDYVSKVILRDSVFFVCGKFNSVNGSPANSIAVVDWNGNFIKSFSGIPVGSDVLMMEVQSDGKVIIVLPVNGPTGLTYRILRLKETGEVDETFQQGDFYLQMEDIKIADNGKIYCAGQMINYNGAIKNNLIRLNSNGSIDNTFITGASPFGGDGYPMSIQLLPNENVLIGGSFSSYRGNTAHGLVQIDKNGNFVATPAFSFGKQSRVTSMQLVGDNLFTTGRIIRNENQNVISVAKFYLGISLKKPQLSASITDQKTGLATLTWDDGSNVETGFDIQRSETVQTAFSSIKTVAANTTSHSETLAPFKKYFYKVRSFNQSGFSSFSNVVSVQWMPVPDAPSQLIAISEDGLMQLSWNDNSALEDGYIIQRTTVQEGLVFSTIDSTSSVTYHDASASAAIGYFYRVAAYNPAGNSAFSNVAESQVMSGIGDDNPSFEIYPNPASSYLIVVANVGVHQPVFELINTTGSSWTIAYTATEANRFELDLLSVPPGLYLVKMTSNGKSIYHKIVKR